MTEKKFEMSMNLNVLHHLGINLYSNIPAVLSEVVANAWDADAREVEISIGEHQIIILDNGNGMDLTDINNKFLKVGYQKREDGNAVTPKFNRPVMGRKGIGKLSLFSIANRIEIHTSKNGNKNGFIISTKVLEEKIRSGDAAYFPEEVESDKIDMSKDGTKIILSELKKMTHNTAAGLKKRLARRFSVIGADYDFNVNVNGYAIGITDREYFHKLQYIWSYTDENWKSDYIQNCAGGKLKSSENRPVQIEGSPFKVYGWIGAVENSGDLKDESENINKIVIMVRGKLAQEDILEEFLEGGLYSKYLIGEIHADFLDVDEEADIATSSRQKIIEDDPRYQLLRSFIQKELKHIQNKWTELRSQEGREKALEIPSIQTWFSHLGRDHKRRAEKLFGKINQLTLDNDAKKNLFKHSVLAFESFRYKENLDALDIISPENIEEFGKIIASFDDIEATLYHQIVTERLKVIDVLREKVHENALERVLQQHIYNHLWLLDPSWERAAEVPDIEVVMSREFKDIDNGLGLTEEERLARFDIKYRKSSGKHIIVELKRSEVSVSTFTLGRQVHKYNSVMKKVLQHAGLDEPFEIICIVGGPLKEWTDSEETKRGIDTLKNYNARVVYYRQLITDAQIMYQSFLEKHKEAGRISRLIQDIDIEMV